ncbi:hypothetical protein DEIPH_ctg046orf0036 [Deinococcus phoenicis]|uniref:Uncharacterized protein n=1 Tax=Deinococcus phoenicis TaxID=1476583 RepID=A0A016QMX3_9DEIO|nr:hypothetical protein [Deinococcus phoenicis]EYB67237.1 hypothetical protein DEIPH_ctg046orf0036 [Deinococcus phoenicis]
MSPVLRLLTASLLAASCGVTLAGQTPSEPAPRSLLLGLKLSDAPRRITGGPGYAAETAQMNRGALAWTLGRCTRSELLYWTTALKVRPGEDGACWPRWS